MSIDYTEGSIKPKDDITLPYIWVALHINAKAERETQSNPRLLRETKRITDEINYFLEAMHQIPEASWTSLCIVSGWTVYGAVALSWCEGAAIKDVWEGWEASGFPLKPLPEFERPARFVNPALMPKTRSLQGIVDEMGNSSIAICAAIASSPEPLEFDLKPEMMKSAKPQLASFLKSRMLEKQDRTAEEEALLKVWSEAVKDTEYDIWEGS